MKADEGVVSATSFTKTAHRFSYNTQIIAAMEFADRFAIQVAPGYMHRNYVPFEDENGLLCIGAVARARIWPNVSLFAEYTHVLRPNSTILNVEYENPLAFGIEFKTFAHAFMLGFMNSPGIGEGQFIPYTASSWGDGEYRFGFTISRHF